MARIDFDETQGSFPRYATLTESRAWTRPMDAVNPGLVADTDLSHRYTEGEVLGVGGMGKVVLARDEHLGRDVAVKQLRDDREPTPDERERFLREARVQGQLEHPSIVPVYDLEQQPGSAAFFTMRRVLGRTLHAILDELRAGLTPPRYSQRELLAAFATVCLAIDYAHSRGVIHRDLKPANLMLGDFGEVYVLDWGLARLVAEEPAPATDEPASRLSVPGAVMGTPLYMAPEQYADPAVGPGADVFSLGAILYEILTLVPARDPAALHAPIAAMAVRAPLRDVAPELEAICLRACAADPALRYPSARALHTAVVGYLDGDREHEQRRSLANTHAAAAVSALARAGEAGTSSDYEAVRGAAMRDLVRAMSLDPDNREHVTTLATIMQALPREAPPEVEQQIFASEQAVVRKGSQASVIALGFWFVFLPVVYALGVVHAYMIAFILVPIGTGVLSSVIGARQKVVGVLAQAGVVASAFLAMMAVSRLFGPLVLGPSLIATYAITLQVHPSGRVRRLMLAVACAAMILPVVLEMVGVLPPSYIYEHGRMIIVPQLIELTPTAALAVLLFASLASMIAPAIFVGQIRDALSTAERRVLLQAWHFRRLGAD